MPVEPKDVSVAAITGIVFGFAVLIIRIATKKIVKGKS